MKKLSISRGPEAENDHSNKKVGEAVENGSSTNHSCPRSSAGKSNGFLNHCLANKELS